ncbi:hypothetical protein GIS00_06990 [Nakamurella sp. YIM 132087]|uniref:PQQ-binding-like beta-propeller repeat protein n=1 Tax=Nakamurella alba TaxID=2665158 RepID=A0A7K1FHT2_9ACTN|nr:hypothetical protein [Nakamurella alba]MTD13687.1 hypothetical protein [Nakamurella alba]
MPATSPRRRMLDRAIAAAIVVVVGVVGLVLYLNSDIRAAQSSPGSSEKAPSTATDVPTRLTERWSAPTDAGLGAVVSPSGVVVTTTEHEITGLDAVTGEQRWSYSRSNRPLCAVGSGDLSANGGGVRGIATVWESNGYCSQVMTFDADTGERSKVRTAPNQVGGSLVFGGGSAGWVGSDLLEVWRNDLVRTMQYGVQPNPTNPDSRHTGCVFTDMAIADLQFGTIEHCEAQGPNARIVLNFDEPKGKKDGWDEYRSDPRMDVDTGSTAALIVGITQDRVAVLVSSPEPAVVLYDAAGTEISRSPVDIPAADIENTAATGTPTPYRRTDTTRYSLIGSTLLAVTEETVQTAPPATALTTPTTSTETSSDASSSPSSSEAPADVSVTSLRVAFVSAGAIGLPAVVDEQLVVPVTGGLSVMSAETGSSQLDPAREIPVDRAGWTGRVDAGAVGSMIVETRGGTVVALS